MIAIDEDALICDLAETYQIYDYKSLPVFLVATLSVGLRENSRIKMKMGDARLPYSEFVLTLIADRLGNLLWSLSEDARKGKNRPAQLLEIIYRQENKTRNADVVTFDTPEEYESARRELLREGGR